MTFVQDGSIPDLEVDYSNKLIEKIIIPAIESNTNGLWSAKIIESNKLEIVNHENIKKVLDLEIRLPFKPQPNNDNVLSMIDADIINDLPGQLERIQIKFNDVS